MSERRNFLKVCLGILGVGVLGSRGSAKASLSTEDVVKAWEDPSYRKHLTEAQWEALPPNPAGEIKSGEFKTNLAQSSGDYCSGNSCSGNNCSGNNCSGDNCSGNNCSGDNCSGNNCSGNNCSGNNC